MSIKQTGGAMIKGFKNLDDVIFVIHESKDNSIIILDDETNLLIRLSLETDPQSISLSGYNITFSYDNMRINGNILYAITGIDKNNIDRDAILAAILGGNNISKLTREQKSSTTSAVHPSSSVPRYINPRQRYKTLQINGINIYFEQQDSSASCGRHAINNLLQMNPRDMYTKQRMMQFCLDITEQNKLESEIKNAQLIEQGRYEEVIDPYQCRDNENYTDQTLIKLMENNHGFNTTVILPTYDQYAQLSRCGDTSLYLINLGEFMAVHNWRQNTRMRHWTAARKIGNDYYYFDSLHNNPIRFNNKDDFILYLLRLKNGRNDFFVFNQ
jgi:hypothetical protein